MMIWYTVIALSICFVSQVQLGNGYRILGVFPTPSISHQVVFRGLTLALNKKGHELVVVTPDPVNDTTLKNYTEIDISACYEKMPVTNFIENRLIYTQWYSFFEDLTDIDLIADYILNHGEVRKLYAPDSNEQFDLMLVEMLFWPSILPLAKRFDVPVIGMASLGLATHVQYAIGNPIMPSHHSNWEMGAKLSTKLSFWQRLENFIIVWKYMYWFKTTYMSKQQAIARRYFGNDIPDLIEFEKNVSLFFVNQQGPISYARPNTPNIIEIGGFHVSKQTITLPKDLQQILDEATEGFVYVSLGSNVRSIMLPNTTLNEFITAFSRLPYKVLWKFEEEVLPNKPDNVHIMKWVPQQAVLAHPNLKVFVYQGGLQSTEEAVAHAVPLVGLPVMADQDIQVNRMVSHGVALKLEITTVDGNELFEAISTVAGDKRYKQRMENLRLLINDRPYDPLENAVWWTEYVIRHRGAPHLQSTTADEPWYSRQDMDVVAFISVGCIIILSLTLVTLYRGLVYSVNAFTNQRSFVRKQKQY